MELNILKPRKGLNKAYLKTKPVRSDIDRFKTGLIQLLNRINDTESEEYHKNLLSDFLKRTYYEPRFFINTKRRSDLVIHNSAHPSGTAGVIIEVKKSANKAEMISSDKVNVKAFQELVLYYLRERITLKNLEIKQLIVTSIYEWFVFDAHVFEKLFAQNKSFVKQFQDFENNRLTGSTTDFFYKQIAEPYISEISQEIECTRFDLRDYEKVLRNADKTDDNQLIALFKVLSPEHLLKLPFTNDSNSLDKGFYHELLHILGLTETKSGGKKVIVRLNEGNRNPGSLLENAMVQLDILDKISRLKEPEQYGATRQDRLYQVALELCITWINRILFLKLLEAQLVAYHKGDISYEFLNLQKIRDYDELNSLFFQVLAKQVYERTDEVNKVFSKIPYLNSSLFEPTEIEHTTLFISNLRNDRLLTVPAATVLKDGLGNKRTGNLNPLEYLFSFLNAYDFSGEGGEEIQEENKTLINASVLGLIFEKINGYQDGSFFTPGYITMYMCRETIRRAVVQKFNEIKGWNCRDLDSLYDKIENRNEANSIINQLKICDPAVGSGHFLVSALNEIIAIKSELNILLDGAGRRLKEYHVEVVNDELMVTDEDGELFEYNPANPESQRVQETLFHEKQTIIENCLFGADINPNSVKICRLRLWIELLKNSYYLPDRIKINGIETHGRASIQELETLPNIDINIKCGNSLISRFSLDADLKQIAKNSKWTVFSYQNAVEAYKQSSDKETKRELEALIQNIKFNYVRTIQFRNPKLQKFHKLRQEYEYRFPENGLFAHEPDLGYGENAGIIENEKERLISEIEKIQAEIEAERNFFDRTRAFEWRFEFPEVLDENGDFLGFDAVLSNPPYYSLTKRKDLGEYFTGSGFQTYSKAGDIYCLFYERGSHLLKNNGYLSYITSNSWLRAIYGEKLKTFIKSNFQPISLINIEDVQVFEEATVESCIFILQKSELTEPFLVSTLSRDYIPGKSLAKYIASNHVEFSIPENSDWFLGRKDEIRLKSKVESNAKLIKDFDIRINFGIKTGFNEAFIIDENKKNELELLNPGNAEIIKPILRGRDLKKYSYEFNKQWIISTFPSWKLNISDYPDIKSHLSFFGKNRLEQSGNQGSRKKSNNKWFETQDSINYWQDFLKPKIIWGEISDKPKFAYDEDKYFAEATTFLMTGEKLLFLLGILNSKVSEWYFRQIGTTTGMGTNRWKKYKIEMFPVKIPSEEQENEIVEAVMKILEIKKQSPASDTTAQEAEIDGLVYQLYGLTEEEISLVEKG